MRFRAHAQGSLTSREFLDDLERLPVRAEIELYERTLLKMLAFRAVGKSLLPAKQLRATI